MTSTSGSTRTGTYITATDPWASSRNAWPSNAADAEAAAEAAKAEEEKQAEADERREKCASSRATMERFVRSRRLYREDESGERVYLDEAETLAARQRVEDAVSEYCNP